MSGVQAFYTLIWGFGKQLLNSGKSIRYWTSKVFQFLRMYPMPILFFKNWSFTQSCYLMMAAQMHPTFILWHSWILCTFWIIFTFSLIINLFLFNVMASHYLKITPQKARGVEHITDRRSRNNSQLTQRRNTARELCCIVCRVNDDVELPNGGHANKYPSIIKRDPKYAQESIFHMWNMSKFLNRRR